MSTPPWTDVVILLELPNELPCVSVPSSTNSSQYHPCYWAPVGIKSDHACTALCPTLGTEDVLPTFVSISILSLLEELA